MDGGVVLFGGSFNPVHHGHLIIARAAAEHLGAARVVLIPSANPPHKLDAELADASDRLEMVRLATENEPGFQFSDLELQREGPSYTYDTVQAFKADLGPDIPLAWLIGAHSLPELHSWYRAGELVEQCRIITAVRPGHESPDLTSLMGVLSLPQIECLKRHRLPTPRIDISATDIRARVRRGLSIRFLVPEAVSRYIADRGLYA
jgi:nicotinate-nucleotide adenylyltransferase